MSQEIRRELISRNLGIIPINHGRVFTFQIGIPQSEQREISLERSQLIQNSFLHYQSNLASIILRRTDAYDNDEIEYEVVYGADWVQVAQSLEIEQLWAWVFDMTNAQAEAAKTELAYLFNASTATIDPAPQVKPANPDLGNLEQLLDRKLQFVTDSLRQSFSASLDGVRSTLEEKLKLVHHKLDQVTHGFSEPDLAVRLSALKEQLDSIALALKDPPAKGSKPQFTGEKINLVAANDSEIAEVLRQVKAQKKQIESALDAIAHWKRADALTWANLEKSTKPKSKDKIVGFAPGTLNYLRQIGDIPSDTVSTMK